MGDVPENVRKVLLAMLEADDHLSTEDIARVSGLSLAEATQALFWAGGKGLIAPMGGSDGDPTPLRS